MQCMTTQLNSMFSFLKITFYEEHCAALQSALKPLYILLWSVWNVTNVALVDDINIPINEIIEHGKLMATTYLTIKILK